MFGSDAIEMGELALFDANGDFLQFVYGSEASDLSAGEYFVSFTGYDPGMNYTLSADTIEDDFAASAGTTGVLELDGSASGRTDFQNDADWFAFTLAADAVVGFSVDTFSGYIELIDSTGNILNNWSESGAAELEAGEYFVSFTGYDVGTEYTLSAATIVDDYAGDTSTTGVLDVDGDSVSGQLDYQGDHDWFAITVEAGDIVNIFADAGVDMNFRAADGSYQGSGFREAGILFDTAGTYYIDVSSVFDPDAAYTLTATSVVDDYANDATTETELVLDTVVNGVAEYDGDEDWFRLSLEEAATLQFDVQSDYQFGQTFAVYSSTGELVGSVRDPFATWTEEDWNALENDSEDDRAGYERRFRTLLSRAEPDSP